MHGVQQTEPYITEIPCTSAYPDLVQDTGNPKLRIHLPLKIAEACRHNAASTRDFRSIQRERTFAPCAGNFIHPQSWKAFSRDVPRIGSLALCTGSFIFNRAPREKFFSTGFARERCFRPGARPSRFLIVKHGRHRYLVATMEHRDAV